MKKTIVIAVTLLCATLARADERKFSAADAPAARIKQGGRIVISNDANRITAFRFFDNIREALVSVRTLRNIVTRTSGSVFDSNARLAAPMPPYLSSLITEASQKHGVDPRLVAAICRRESAFNPNAVSPVGAGGVMQLMPATARYLGVSNVFDARQNIFAGTRYLRTLLDAFNGDLDLAVAAYNAGPGAVRKYNGIPPYAETRAYVVAVRRNYERSLNN
jgi:soluble lytic murein transglycosylase-like protein